VLVRTQTGRQEVAVPISTMRSAVALPNGTWRITDADGEAFIFSQIDWEIALELNPVATVPAAPGTYLVHLNDDAEGPSYYRSNVLGWILGLDNVLRPLVIDPELLIGGWRVLHPDGRVETNGGESWDTVSEWLDAARKEV